MNLRAQTFGLIIILGLSLFAGAAYAQGVPVALNVTGELHQPGTFEAITNPSVNFRLELWDKAGTCRLYSEEHVAENLKQTNGRFSITLGDGSNKQNLIAGTGTLSAAVFANPGSVPAFTGCAAGVTLASGDERQLRIAYDLGGGYVQLSPDVAVLSSAYAVVAETLEGYHAADFLRVADNGSTALSQTNTEYAFSAVNWPRLKALLDGVSSQYLPTTPTAPLDFNNQKAINVADPVNPQDVVNKRYADGNLGGHPIDQTAVGPMTGNGSTLLWDATANKWVAGALNTSPTGSAGGNLTGTYPNPLIANNAITSAKIQATGIAVNRLIITDPTTGTGLTYGECPIVGQVYSWTATGWMCTAVVDLSPVRSVAGKTGDVTLNAADIGGLGTAAVRDYGTAAGQIPLLDAQAKMPPVDGSQLTGVNAVKLQTRDVANVAPATGQVLGWNGSAWVPVLGSTGTVTSVDGRNGILGGPITTNGTLYLDTGTAASQILQLNAAAQLPAVDGSLLTKVNAVALQTRPVSVAAPTGGQVLGWNISLSQWEPIFAAQGSVINIGSGTGLLGGPISQSGTLSVDVGTSASKILQLNASAQIPAVDGSLLTFVNAVKLQTRTVAATQPNAGQVLGWNNVLSQWEPVLGTAGSVTNIATTNGILGGPITSTGTISIDTGTTASKILQLNASAQIPAVDGSLLTFVNAVKLQTRSVAATQPNAGQVLGWNNVLSQWEPVSGTAGAVTNVATGVGLLGGPITSTGTIVVDVGSAANKIVQENNNAQIAQIPGTAALPSYSFAGDLDTGLNSASANQLSLVTNGTASLTVIANGNVGIGTSLPGYPLDVAGTVRAYNFYSQNFGTAGSPTFAANGAGIYMPATNNLAISTASSERLRIDASGNVGIGTTSPLAGLDIATTGTAGSAIIVPRDTASNRPTGVNGMLRYNTDIAKFEGYAGGVWATIAAGSAAGTVTNVATSTGLLGGPITTNGTLSVDVGSAANKIVQENVNAQIAQMLGTAALPSYTFAGDTNTGFYSPSADQLSLVTNGSAALTAASTGYIGIGTTAPAYPLDVQVNSNTYTGINLTNLSTAGSSSADLRMMSDGITSFLRTYNAASGNLFQVQTNANSMDIRNANATGDISLAPGNATAITLKSSGRIGIGTNNPQAGFDISLTGSSSAILIPRDTAANRPAGVNGMLRYNTDIAKFEGYAGGTWATIAAGSAAGTVTNVATSTGLLGGPITTNGTLSVDVGSAANKIVQENVNAQIAQMLGTVALPSYSFAGNTATGLYSPGANQLGFVTNGTSAMNILANGNVGIGTASPAGTLDIRGGTAAVASSGQNILLYAQNSGNGAGANVGGSIIMIPGTGVASTGSVAIGTTAPTNYFEVQGGLASSNKNGLGITMVAQTGGNTGYTSGGITLSGANGAATSAGGTVVLNGGTGGTSGGAGGNVILSPGAGTGGGANGMVGVGTSTPTAALDIFATGSTSAIVVPRDTTANRPNGVNGMLRYSTSLNALEGYINGAWSTLSAGSAAGTVTNVATSTGLRGGPITTNGTLSVDVGSAANKIVQENGNAQIAQLLGTVALPSYTFSGNTNTGFYSPGANQVSLAINGTAALNVIASGNVGIGTATPNAPLEVRGPSSVTEAIQIYRPTSTAFDSVGLSIYQDNASAARTKMGQIDSLIVSNTAGAERAAMRFYVNSGNNIQEYMRFAGYGNVGIGTGSPVSGAVLDIYGTGPSLSTMVVPRDTTANRPMTGVNGMLRYNTSLNAMEGYINGTWATLSSGSAAGTVTNVAGGTGILGGPITTNGTLSVDVGSAASKIVQENANAQIAQTLGTLALPSYTFAGNLNTGLYSPAANQMSFVTNGTAALNVLANGNIGVGTASAANRMSFESPQDTYLAFSQGGSDYVKMGRADSGGALLSLLVSGSESIHLDSRNGYTNYVNNGGKFGIGSTAPQAGLDVATTGTGGSAILIPRDTTANRPAGVNGMLRYSTTLNAMEGYINGAWSTLASGSAAGTVTNVAGGTGILGGPITTNGTLSVDVGTGGNKVVQENANAQIAQALGTVSVPSYSFAGSLNTGLYSPGTGRLALSTSGTAALNVLANGFVGIGTDAPATTLEVNGIAKFNAGMTIASDVASGGKFLSADNSAATPTYSFIYSSDTGMFSAGAGSKVLGLSTAGTERVRVDGSGKVGVGTQSPQGILDLYATGSSSALVLPRDTTANRPTGVNGMLRYSTTLNAMEGYINGAWSTLAAGGSAGTVTNVATSTGLLGGPITTNGTLSVDVGSAANKIVQENANAQIAQATGTSSLPSYSFFANTNTGMYSPGTNQVALVSNGAAALNVGATGNVGVGSTTPVAKLDLNFGVISSAALTTGLAFNGDGTLFANTATASNGTADEASLYRFAPVAFWSPNTAVTTTNAATVKVQSAPSATGGMSLTNASALWVDTAGTNAVNGFGVNATSPFGATNGVGGRFTGYNLSSSPTTLSGVEAGIANNGAGTTASAYGLRVTSPVVAGGGAITSYYGVYIQPPTTAGTNYALYSEGGTNYFGGKVGIGTSAPLAALDVATTGTSSAIIVPRDTTANRPTGVNGMLRYSTTLNALEGYVNGSWSTLAAGSSAGTVTNVAGGTGILGGPITTNGTLSVDVGSAASKIVQENVNAQIAQMAGSVALPSYSFAGNLGTGLSSPSANQLSLVTNGTAALNVAANGFVGLGTTAPTLAKLQIAGAPTTAALFGSDTTGTSLQAGWPAIGFNSYYAGAERSINTGYGGKILVDQSAGGLTFQTADTVTGQGASQTMSTRMRVSNAGNVGVGIEPVSLLDLYGAGSPAIRLGNDSGVQASLAANATSAIIGTPGAFPLAMQTNGAERLRITPIGSIGIGTAAPQAVLDVVATGSASAIIVPRDTTANRPTGLNGMLRYNTSLNALEGFVNGAWNALAINGTTSWANNGTSVYYNGGNVGIGTATPAANLQVYSTSAQDAMNVRANNGGVFKIDQYGQINSNTISYFNANVIVTGTETVSGSLGIGTATPQATLDVNGAASVATTYEGIDSSYANSGTAYTIPDANTAVRRVTLTGNATITLPAYTAPAGKMYSMTVFLKQDGTGGRTVAFAGNGSDVVKWDSNVAPTISSTAGKITIIQLMKPADEAVWYGSMVWKEN